VYPGGAVKRVGAASVAGVLTLAVLGACGSENGGTTTTPSPSRTTTSPSALPPTATTSSDSASRDEDVLREFFGLIDEGRAADAVRAMSSATAGDDASKQAWGVQFDAVTSVRLLRATPSAPEEWTVSRHTYKVLLDVTMDPASADAPIPYYGYLDGENLRWVTLVNEEGTWKIDAIATGP
jgi:hypothetical protein